MAFTKKQVCFLNFCRYALAISWFKRYWPMGGSYWNKHHMNKNDINDVKMTLDDANSYTRQHVQVSFSLVVIFICMMYSGQVPAWQYYAYIGAFIMEAYAFTAHHYNRILAKEQLALLASLLPDKGEYEEKDYCLNIEERTFALDDQTKTHFYRVVFASTWESLSPLFLTREEAIAYRKHIYKSLELDPERDPVVARVQSVSRNLFRHGDQDLKRVWINTFEMNVLDQINKDKIE